MADIALSVAAKIAELLVDPVIHHARYLFCFKKIVGNLEKEKQELILRHQNVAERVKEAKRKTEIVQPSVEKWENEVDDILQEVKKLEREIEARKNHICGPFQYFLAKQAENETKKMMELKNKSTFDQFSKQSKLPGMKDFKPKNLVRSKSTEEAYNKLLDALKDNKNNIIGLHGMGGSGKSTLVKRVGKTAEESKLFDNVVIAVVSQQPQVSHIQDQIAEQLGLILNEGTPMGRAQRLLKSLENERTLVILDDVWGKLELEAIGIPPNCTVLLTARGRDTCVSIDCKVIVELSLLTEVEAWNLFKICAGIDEATSDDQKFKDVATRIVDKSQGLPIAIATMGSALKGKHMKEWQLASVRLEASQLIDLPQGFNSPYVCIKLSYDNLTNKVAKSLFLLCSMFPEDYLISVDELVRYVKGPRPGGITGPMNKARAEVDKAIHDLIDSSLLLPTNKNGCVKMHDLVRDVALWIASEESQAIVVRNKVLEVDDINEDKATISLWCMENFPITEKRNFPKLKTFLYSADQSLSHVPNLYFAGMEMLEVLIFVRFAFTWRNLYTSRNLESSMSILRLPPSIDSLVILRTLCLRAYDLGDISLLVNLRRLEILDLRSSSFDELPEGIAKLENLKLLDLYTCKVKSNPYEVIGRCSKLKELYIWIIEDCSLPDVTLPALEKYVIIVSDKIRYDCRFLIDAYLEEHVPSNALCIDGFEACSLSLGSSSMRRLFQKTETLYFRNLPGGYKNIIPQMDQEGMTELVGLIFEACEEIKCLVDTNTNNINSSVFSKLVTLKLIWMTGLEEVFRDSATRCSLEKLEDVQIEYCAKLRSISFPQNSNLCNLKILRLQSCPMFTSFLFTPEIARTLMLLEELKLFDCIQLKHIIEGGEAGCASNQYQSLKVFPNLRILYVHKCERLESILPISFVQHLARLERIDIWYNFELKYVFGTYHNQYEQSFSQNNNWNKTETKIHLRALTRLSLVSLSNLIGICPPNYHTFSPNLKQIECRECPEVSTSRMCETMTCSDLQHGSKSRENREILWVLPESYNEEHIVGSQAILNLEYLTFERQRVEGILELQIEGAHRSEEAEALNSNLSHMYLMYLHDLRFIWTGPKEFLRLQKLKYIMLVECKKLKSIFSSTIVRSLPELNEVIVSKCEELEEIICSDSESEEQSKSLSTRPKEVCFPVLSVIHVFQCNKLKCLFSASLACQLPELEFLTIEECCKIEHVFKCNHKVLASGVHCDGEGDKGPRGMFVEDRKFMVLPKLRELKLVSLPNFIEFCEGPYNLRQNVKHHTMENCPNYTYDLASD